MKIRLWDTMSDLFPAPSIGNPSKSIYQAQQNRHFYQRPDCGCQCLVAVWTKSRNSYSNGQLKVVTGRCEALRYKKLVLKLKHPTNAHGREKDNGKVYNKRSGNAKD